MTYISRKIQFVISFPRLIEPVSEFWRVFVAYLTSEKALPENFTLSGVAGHPDHLTAKRGDPEMVLTANEIEAVISDRSLTGFAVDAGYSERGVRFHLQELCDIRNRDVVWEKFVSHIRPKAEAPDNWANLFDLLLKRWSSIGAWQYVTSYLGWQTCSTKSSYDYNVLGELPPGFRLFPDPDFDKSTAIGPCRTFIDISLNPGRSKVLLPGTDFYPTAEMWLGPHFWQYSKCSKEEALAADFFIAKKDTPHYLYLKCWPEPFTRPDGEQGRMQQRLWKLFFHEDCEWPPGSGTICDEPMYGPPELMPDPD